MLAAGKDRSKRVAPGTATKGLSGSLPTMLLSCLYSNCPAPPSTSMVLIMIGLNGYPILTILCILLYILMLY
jgi:hypothetical protein